MLVGFVFLILSGFHLFGGVQGQTVINVPQFHACPNELKIANYSVCMDAMRDHKSDPRNDPCTEHINNECFYDALHNVYDCTWNATSYEVACACPSPGWKEGRISDIYLLGRDCDDVDECAMETDICDPFRSTCSNTNGSYVCVCAAGYVSTISSPFTCSLLEDSDACDINAEPVCSLNATCVSITREKGCYIAASNSALSAPADLESATLTAFECMEHCFGNTTYAALVNTSCYCTDTYPTGNTAAANCDVSCGPTANELCGSSDRIHASYYQVGPDHTCTCNPGFEGDGQTCSNIDECATATIPDNALCVDLVNDSLIVCHSTYIFNGSGECVPYTELDCGSIDNPETDSTLNRLERWAPDCSRVRFLNCDGSGTAEEVETGTTAGSSACMSGSLVSTYDGDSFTFSQFNTNMSWALLTPVVTCGETTFSVVLDRSVLNAAGFNLANMALGDFPFNMDPTNYSSECRGRRYADSAGLRYIFEHDFSDKCGVVRDAMSSDEEIITFVLSGVFGLRGPVISRRTVLRYEMDCTYSKARTLLTPVKYRFYTPLRKRRDLLSADNQLTLQAKSDATFSSALDISSPLIKGDIAYLEVDLPSLKDNYALQWLQCWQSDSADPKLGKKRVILENGCLASNGDKLENSVTIYKNTATKSQLAFSPTSFSGGESEDIYIHCVVNKCDQSGDQTCSEVCASIGGDDKGSVTLLSTTEMVTSGKIVLKDVCGGSGNGGCEQLCSVSEDNRAVCGCVRGFQVDPDDLKMCKAVPSSSPASRSGDGLKWYYIAIPVVTVFLITVALMVAHKARKPKHSSYKMPDLALGDDDE